MKKLMILMLIVTQIFSLVGCVLDRKLEENKDVNEKLEIEFWYGVGGKIGNSIEDIIDTFNQSQDQIIVKGIQQGSYDETLQALQAAIISNTAPACVLLNYHDSVRMMKRNALTLLNPFIDEDESFVLDDIYPIFLSTCIEGDNIYALPLLGATQVLYYRKDMFEQAGLSPDILNTWEGLAEAARKLTKKADNEVIIYGWEPIQGKTNLCDAAVSNGGQYISQDGTEVLIDSEEWIEAWDSIRKWIHEEQIMKVHYGGQGWEYWYATIDDVMQGRAAGYIGSSGDQGDLDPNIIMARVQPGWENHKASPYANSNPISIPNSVSDKEKEAAFEFIKFFISKENTAKFAIETGYMPVRKSAVNVPEFVEFSKKNPNILVPLEQLEIAVDPFIDPTGGKIDDALSIAAEKLEIENIPAEIVLREAKEKAQKALDEVLHSK